jgi:heme a synthase
MTERTTKHNRAVAVWLLVCCTLVFAMVMLGGVTRLTGSGLSMVDWRPVTGVLPPLQSADWNELFSAYQLSPEFRKINHDMNMAEFKNIFWLEYAHRLLGRVIGLVFALPFIFFLLRGYITRSEWPRYSLMFALGGLQGLLGWYMVKSGLVDNPHVSQYRLTVHLVAAFAIYAYLFWTAMSLLFRATDPVRHSWYGRTLVVTSFVFITVVSGGFVAGLKAGLVYNTFPLMAGHVIPPGLFSATPVWRNIFENITTVQFDHRYLGLLTFGAIVTYWFYSCRQASFPPRARLAVHLLLAACLTQVFLGIATLLLRVPIPLAAAHQANALVLFTVALYLCHCLRGRPV